MSTVKVIYRRKPVLNTFLNLAFLSWGNYELYNIYHGTHPTFSPYLEKAGLYSPSAANNKDSTENKPGDHGSNRPAQNPDEEDGWMRINSVPIPTLETLIRPFRRD